MSDINLVEDTCIESSTMVVNSLQITVSKYKTVNRYTFDIVRTTGDIEHCVILHDQKYNHDSRCT